MCFTVSRRTNISLFVGTILLKFENVFSIFHEILQEP